MRFHCICFMRNSVSPKRFLTEATVRAAQTHPMIVHSQRSLPVMLSLFTPNPNSSLSFI